MTIKTAVVNGKCVDSDGNVSVRNLLVGHKKIKGIGYIPDENEDAIDVVDVTQSLLMPNTFDFVYAPPLSQLPSTVQSVQSCGMHHMALIPNGTTAPLDHPDTIAQYTATTLPTGSLGVIASATKQNEPDDLAPMALLHDAGAHAIYFGRIIENESLIKQALSIVDTLGCPIVIGPMTHLASKQYHLNDGNVSFMIGVPGESVNDECRMVQTMLSLIQEFTRVPIHFLAISSPRALACIQAFKLTYPGAITVGTSPFHLQLTDQALRHYHPSFKLNPPLRTAVEADALSTALGQSHIDHLTALHAPTVTPCDSTLFFDAPPQGPTMPFFFPLASHVVIQSGLNLPDIEALFSAPSSFKWVKKNELSIYQPASFIGIKNRNGDAVPTPIFDESLNLMGGVDIIMMDGQRI